MESKTKHRILGILVVAGLIVILLPFLQSGKELPTEATTVKTPPFPDQSIQLTTAPPLAMTPVNQTPEEVKQQPDDTIKADHPTTSNPTVPTINNPVTDQQLKTSQPINSNAKPQATNPDKAEQKPTVVDTASAAKKNSANKVEEKVTKAPEKATSNSTPTKKTPSTPKQLSKKVKHAPYVHAALDDNGLFKLHSAAWVIQVGSFKNKANALRVVNNLRANGYRAFIQQISTTLGENTRVFVGPESKQSAARELAQTLESDMHLRGIVISYKPLAL